MAHRLRLVALVLGSLGLFSAHAGYVYPSAPGGWRNNGPMSPNEYAAKTVLDSITGNIIRSGNELTVPTGTAAAKVPVAYRLQAAAGRVAAAAIFANPYVRASVGIATWLGVGKVVWDSATNTWHTTADPNSDLNKYYKTTQTGDQEFSSFESACSSGVAALPATGGWSYSVKSSSSNQCVYTQSWNGTVFGEAYLPITEHQRQASGCPDGYTQAPSGCISPALTQPQMVELLNPENQPGWPMPSTVPAELPYPTYLPVDPPIVNPSSDTNPVSRPLFIPSGNPIANPSYDPNGQQGPDNQPWFQPGVRLVPSPTAVEPWRVDVQPVNRPVGSPNPNPEPQPEDDPNGNDKPKPEEQQSLCEKHPDVVACAKTGSVEAVPVPNEDKQLAINKDSGYGPESGTCPAPKTATVMGQSLAFKYDLLCDFAGYIKPIVIAFAWLSAALTFFGFSRKDS